MRCRLFFMQNSSVFIVFSAEPVGRVMLLEAAHTSDPSVDPAMVLFESIIQIDTRPVADPAAQR